MDASYLSVLRTKPFRCIFRYYYGINANTVQLYTFTCMSATSPGILGRRCWVTFHSFVVVCLFQINFLKKLSFRNTNRVSNSLDPDQAVGPDLGPNCLKGYQQMTKVTASRQRVITIVLFLYFRMETHQTKEA